jgi:RHH-type transcriptional regulator, rel operon repressor / antitoxin RelB
MRAEDSGLPADSTAWEDLEDARIGAEALERFRASKEKSYSLDEVMAELGLDSSDL